MATTGTGSKEERRRSEEAGIHLHLTKPVDPEQPRCLLQKFQRLFWILPDPALAR